MASSKTSKKRIVKAGPTCDGPACPLCTKEGIVLVATGFAMLFMLPDEFAWTGLLVILSAYLLPMIKMLIRRNRER